jgi:hypothetical protein
MKGKGHFIGRRIWEEDVKVGREEIQVGWKVVGWITWLRIGSGGRIL